MQGCDYELIHLKIENMETIIDLTRERIEELERIRNGKKSVSIAKEENISIDGSVNDQENKGKALEIRRRKVKIFVQVTREIDGLGTGLLGSMGLFAAKYKF